MLRGGEEEEVPEKLKGCDPVLVERIENDIIDRGDPITFDDIAGLAFAKKCVMELVCWPMARPDIFTVRERQHHPASLLLLLLLD